MWTGIPKISSHFVCYKRFFKNAPEGEYIIYSLVVFKHEDKLSVECTVDGPGYDPCPYGSFSSISTFTSTCMASSLIFIYVKIRFTAGKMTFH